MEIFKLKLHPTAGFIPNLEKDSEPGSIDRDEKEYLRTLACRVYEIANDQKQGQKRNLWYRHTRLEKVRPMLLVFPEDAWFQIINIEQLKIEDLFWKQWEWYFKHLIYRHERLKDDFVIEPEIYVTSVVHSSGWGLEAQFKKTSESGSYIWDPPVKSENDIRKLKYPVIEIDEKLTKKRFDAVNELFGDIFPVKLHCGIRVDACLIGEAAHFRGIEQLMLDIYDRPEWLHEYMNFFTEATLHKLKFLEDNGLLSLNNKNHYTDSGGIGYSDELPGSDFDENEVHPYNMWGFGVAQEFSEVSPAHHEEFILNYQLQILKFFGMNSYGCCEPYTNKFDMVFKVPRLRRVSVSPWCNPKVAAEKLKNNYIYSWKPNPSFIVGKFDRENIRSYIHDALAEARNCVVEIILKDLITIDNEPERLELWISIVREEIEKLWNE